MQNDPTKQLIKMYSHSKDRWYPLMATFDIGSSHSWVSSHVMDLLQLKVLSEEPSEYSTLSGEKLVSREVASDVIWCGYKSPRVRETEFHIVEGAHFEVLFGSEFLFSEAIYRFNESALSLKVEAAAQENNTASQGSSRSVGQNSIKSSGQSSRSSGEGSKPALQGTSELYLVYEWCLYS
jgi:hypothetical protein